MQGDDLSARLRATFLQELGEQLRELNAALLQLEQRPQDEEPVRTLFRSAHTVKGAARVAGAGRIEEACHALEAVFAELREGSRRLEGADFSLLFAVLDALEEAGRALRTTGDDDAGSGPLRSLLPRLRAMAGPQAVPSQPGPRPRTESRKERREQKREQTLEDRRQDKREAESAGAPKDAAPVAEAIHRPEAGDLVRVDAARLDALVKAVGELLIAAGRIVERSDADDADARRLDSVVDDVADVARRLRLRPFGDACEALPRAVRDIAARENKEVDLEVEGEGVEADRLVIDALREPLLHLVRNAVDHGVEPPSEREARGKPRRARVVVRAQLGGGRLIVTVSDDGAGIDEEAVRAAVKRHGRRSPRGRAELEEAVLGGGFSTREQASEISGRGVGVDLVRSAIERIGGAVEVDWEAGSGTTFTLTCPPTPATLRALLLRVGAQLYAVPTPHVERLRRVRADQLRSVEGVSVLPTQRGPVPVHSLAALLGPPLEARPLEDAAPLVVIQAGARRAGLVVDEVLAEDEIVVRPLDVDESAVPWASGAAVLPSGRIALVLAVGPVLSATVRRGTAIAPAFAARREAPPARILVADDSITTRTLEQSVLEAAGYTVATAVDGEDAWRQLERDGADLLVADVEMPRMDGFTLCRRIRASERLADLPVVLVTGLASDADRARGLEAGADAYIVKSNFDQESLLDTVRQLTSRE